MSNGVFIRCERVDGYTVAWVDESLSESVPPGYFVEWWPAKYPQGHDCGVAYVGALDSGYYGDDERLTWGMWHSAAAWCYRDAEVQRFLNEEWRRGVA